MTRRYFSQRTGSAPDNISLADFASRFNIIFSTFVRTGYFIQMGVSSQSPGYADMCGLDRLEDKLVLVFGLKGKGMVPLPANIENLDRDSLFDLIEFLADRVSKHNTSKNDPSDIRPVGMHNGRFIPPPIDTVTNSFNLYHAYDHKEGQKKWRDALNKHLVQLNPPCKITEKQTIEILPTSEGLQQLVDSCASPSEDTQSRIKHAQELFLKHGATKDDKHSALKDLMDVLEIMRLDIKKYIPREEKELFNIANNYAIRHYNNKQKTGYDESYLQWFFYAILAAIDLVTKLKLANND